MNGKDFNLHYALKWADEQQAQLDIYTKEHGFDDTLEDSSVSPGVLAARIRELEEANANYKRYADISLCVYCGHESKKDQEAMMKHAAQCEKRPDYRMALAMISARDKIEAILSNPRFLGGITSGLRWDEKLKVIFNELGGGAREKELVRLQPCGCIICKCEDPTQCQGCGARHCGKHPVGEIPHAVYGGDDEVRP